VAIGGRGHGGGGGDDEQSSAHFVLAVVMPELAHAPDGRRWLGVGVGRHGVGEHCGGLEVVIGEW